MSINNKKKWHIVLLLAFITLLLIFSTACSDNTVSQAAKEEPTPIVNDVTPIDYTIPNTEPAVPNSPIATPQPTDKPSATDEPIATPEPTNVPNTTPDPTEAPGEPDSIPEGHINIGCAGCHKATWPTNHSNYTEGECINCHTDEGPPKIPVDHFNNDCGSCHRGSWPENHSGYSESMCVDCHSQKK